LDDLDDLDLVAMGKAAREEWQLRLSPEVSRTTLLDTYRAAIAGVSAKLGRAP
jgi:hypothetical protein